MFIRLFWLGVIGFIHSVFMWDGDILLSYGITGLGAVMLIHGATSGDNLLRTGIVLFSIGIALLLCLGLLTGIDGQANSFWTPTAARAGCRSTMEAGRWHSGLVSPVLV
ncbi:Predicted membrane protein [Budvicia aquatica]|uniref:Predicted membrane protein n=1 Tax=Budvicia aquatica TaxID=82979 RepID=A0A484ZNV1_9GAMM|nr:Predicted membrane protein [Budvicia aquatica]